MTNAIWLEVNDATVEFGPAHVLSGVSFALEQGEIGCLLGSSGCGKTTLLRSIAGFEKLASGEIVINQSVLSGRRQHVPAEQRNIGMVFQDYALFPHLNVLKNVMFGLRANGESEKKARALIERVGLAGKEKHMPHQLSGGEQQRVALARALAPEPILLLLDEPFSNLDVSLRERLGHEVREIIKESNTTALMVTHDQMEAFAIADKVGVMNGGRIEQWDSAYDIYHRPDSLFVAGFVGLGSLIEGELLGCGSVKTVLGVFKQGDDSECCATPVDCQTGKKVKVLLRPDDIIHDDDSPLQGLVRKKSFRGAEFMYSLGLSNGETIVCMVPSHHDHPVGEPIGIRMEVDHVVVFDR
jgi:iron(III) transport system ATP-binding protein